MDTTKSPMAKDNRVSSTNTEPENGTSPAAVSCQLQDDKHVEPLYVSSIKGIDDITQPMLPAFEGRESESNWLLRYQHVHTLRCLAIGNAPTDFSAHYANTMESLLEGILKVVNSLRTTLCTSACTLLQEIVQAVKARADPWIDLLMNNLLKLCGSLKKLTSNAANETITVIIRNVSDNTRLITHILGASVDKNVRLRLFAPGWVKEIIQKPPTLEDGNDSSELHVAMKNGVTDPNPSVREYMRKVYWTYAGTWPERAQQIFGELDPKTKSMLERDNPNRSRAAVRPSSDSGPRSKSAPAPKKSSGIRAAIAIRNRKIEANVAGNVERHPEKQPAVNQNEQVQ